MTQEQVDELKMDDAIAHRSGTVHIVQSRRGEGWWLDMDGDGAGLSEAAALSDDWMLLMPEIVREIVRGLFAAAVES